MSGTHSSFQSTKSKKVTMTDYIPLTTHNYKITFCQVTNRLPQDVQKIIWNKTIEIQPVAPRAPIKPKPSKRLSRLMDGWVQRKL